MKAWQQLSLGIALVGLAAWFVFRPNYEMTFDPYNHQQWLVDRTSGHTWMLTGGRWLEVTH